MKDIERIEIAREKLSKITHLIPGMNEKEKIFQNLENGVYKYYIGKGNNSELVRRVM